MSDALRWLLLAIFLINSGCGNPSSTVAVAPLSKQEWEKLPESNDKYSDETLQRLRVSTPELQDDEAFGKFMFGKVVPARKKLGMN